MKEETQKIKEATNEVAAQNKRFKLWDRRPPAEKTDPFPGLGNKIRATILCMVLAHARGKIHCRKMGNLSHGAPSYIERRCEIKTLEEQRAFVQAWLDDKWRPPLTKEEGEIAKKLLDWGDIGRHAAQAEWEARKVGAA